ncbi:protein lethal(2)essential for life-like [Pararge aegeria]|uniref:Jg16980 protein n=2 Tax=Pararge aegeria TaxID=116150 RepID=A0A8S4RIV7_9NEOP|nr:protein lethal(2)essential for life-like [Pararge aegeria]CAH2236742.1 jg16980 [Pararge aegeria aegeria]
MNPFFMGFDGPPLTRSRFVIPDFGLPMPHDHILQAIGPMMTRDPYRPWPMAPAERDFGSTIKSDKKKFHVTMDVQHFAPEEITVKIVDNYVVIEGKHEEKKDEHGFITRQFTRKYALPQDCDPDTVESKLSSDGVLSIIARKIAAAKNERNVPITQTGPVRMEIKNENVPQAEQNAEQNAE